MKVLYIAGYGRSGSTVLEIALSQGTKVVAMGEMVQVDKYGADAVFCTCLRKVSGCESYRGMAVSSQNLFASKIRFFISNLLQIMKTGRSHIPNSIRYVSENWRDDIIVDSSKSTFYSVFRPYNYRSMGADVYIFFNRRRTKGVLDSLLAGSNSDLKDGVSGKIKTYALFLPRLINFVIFGRVMELFYRAGFGDKVMRVDFDSFLSSPLSWLERMSNFCGEPLEESKVSAQLNQFEVKHSVAGNRLRAGKCGHHIVLKD